jgi:outer membrane protein TolC
MLSGKLTILDFGRTSLGERAAEAALRAEQQALIQAKVELVRSARGAYLAWIEAHETWQLAQKDAEVTAARTGSVRELILEGARPATDATLSTYDEQLAKLRATRARRATKVAFEALSAAVADKLPEASVPDFSVIEPEPQRPAPSVDGASPAATVADPTLRALELQRDAALSAARAADRSHAPQLDALGEFGLSGQDSELFPAYRAALSLSVPIYDGGAQSALAEQHRAEARGLDARRQKVELALQAQQTAAENAIRATGEELALTLELLATAETLLSEAEDHYPSGSDTLERVLSAQRSLVQARREVLSAKLENARARLELAPVHIQE